jgi:hypothetical protein
MTHRFLQTFTRIDACEKFEDGRRVPRNELSTVLTDARVISLCLAAAPDYRLFSGDAVDVALFSTITGLFD